MENGLGIVSVVTDAAEEELSVQVNGEFVCPGTAVAGGIGVAESVVADETGGEEVYLLADVSVILVAGDESGV